MSPGQRHLLLRCLKGLVASPLLFLSECFGEWMVRLLDTLAALMAVRGPLRPLALLAQAPLLILWLFARLLAFSFYWPATEVLKLRQRIAAAYVAQQDAL